METNQQRGGRIFPEGLQGVLRGIFYGGIYCRDNFPQEGNFQGLFSGGYFLRWGIFRGEGILRGIFSLAVFSVGGWEIFSRGLTSATILNARGSMASPPGPGTARRQACKYEFLLSLVFSFQTM